MNLNSIGDQLPQLYIDTLCENLSEITMQPNTLLQSSPLIQDSCIQDFKPIIQYSVWKVDESLRIFS